MDIKEIDERLKNYYPSQHIDDGFYDNAPLLQARIDLSDLMVMVKSLQAERDKYREEKMRYHKSFIDATNLIDEIWDDEDRGLTNAEIERLKRIMAFAQSALKEE